MSGAGSINAALECSGAPTLEAVTLPAMARRPLLLPPLVLLLLAAGMLVAEASESKNRIKLCGRDFLRTIIFICGSSRWKRSSMGKGVRVGQISPPRGSLLQGGSWTPLEGARLKFRVILQKKGGLGEQGWGFGGAKGGTRNWYHKGLERGPNPQDPSMLSTVPREATVD